MRHLQGKPGGQRAAKIVGVPYRTLDHWIRTGLLAVETPARGKGYWRAFSFLDLLRARCVAELRRYGVSLQTIRRVQDELTRRYGESDPLAQGERLIVAGDRLMWALDDQVLLDVLRYQLAARPLVILPIGELAFETHTRLMAMVAA